ncbi:hypothetical protein NKH77_32455 [Streptomyces sp. M19]
MRPHRRRTHDPSGRAGRPELRTRLREMGAQVLITADGDRRRGAVRAQAARRPGAHRLPGGPQGSRRPPRRPAGALDARPRPVVARGPRPAALTPGLPGRAGNGAMSWRPVVLWTV